MCTKSVTANGRIAGAPPSRPLDPGQARAADRRLGRRGGAAVASRVGSYRELSRFGEAKRSELQATARGSRRQRGRRRGARATAPPPCQALERDRPHPGRALRRDPRRRRRASSRRPGPAWRSRRTRRARPQSSLVLAHADATAPSSSTADIVKGGRKVGTLGLLVDTSELAERLRQALLAALASAPSAPILDRPPHRRAPAALDHPPARRAGRRR